MDSLQASSAHHQKLTPQSWEIKLKVDLSEINSMEEEMKKNAESNRWRKEPCPIFKVPTFLRWSSLKSYNPKEICYGPYDPRFVSIGPFHRGDSQLQDMEEFKWRAVQFLLSKSKEKATLNDCLNKMEELGPRARSCYSKTFEHISGNDWAKMMLLDGCFVLLILKDKLEDIVLLPDRDDKLQPAAGSNKNDGAIPPAWPIRKALLADLLLLENQVPFFVLDELFKLLMSDGEDFEELVELALCELLLLYPGTQYASALSSNTKIHHLLHLFYLAIVPKQSETSTRDDLISKMMNKCWGWSIRRRGIRRRGIPSVTELEKSGIKFKANNKAESIMDVTFDYQKGVMWIPPLILYTYTQTTLRNIIAFEQCFGVNNELTCISDYVILVDFLVVSSADISTLQDKGIVLNWFGSQEEVLTVLKQLRSEVVGTDKDKFVDMYSQINMYREIPLHKYRATLYRDYCGDPWILCSLFAGIVLFVLTALQTYTAMYSYYHPSPAS